VSFDIIANAAALAVIAVLAIIYWHGKRQRGNQPPGGQR
jgi:hypothetical protein